MESQKVLIYLILVAFFWKKLVILQKDKLHLQGKVTTEMTDDSLFLIDIEKILRQKAGAKYKWIPRFVVSYLKRIVHQDELNVFLRENADKVGVEFLEACMKFLDAKVIIRGQENLPSEGRCTFVSNHPLGGQDGVALGYILGTHYDGNVRYLVNDLLMNLHGLAPLCIPINKTGKQSRDFPRMVEAGFASENHIIMFPAGLCSRRQNGVIRDLEWKKTFVTKSVETQRWVVPLHFEGRNSDFFYRLANVCKALGLKFNVAMLYLADEMLKNRHKTFTLTIGKPIPWQTFDHSKTPSEWAQYVKDIVYKL
jgi:putative hemolysin